MGPETTNVAARRCWFRSRAAANRGAAQGRSSARNHARAIVPPFTAKSAAVHAKRIAASRPKCLFVMRLRERALSRGLQGLRLLAKSPRKACRARRRASPSSRVLRMARPPVVGHSDRLPVSQVRDGDVAVDATVAVVRAPLHNKRVAAGMAPTDPKSQTFEVRLHFANAFPAVYHLAPLRPLTHCIAGPRDTEDSFESRVVGGWRCHLITSIGSDGRSTVVLAYVRGGSGELRGR